MRNKILAVATAAVLMFSVAPAAQAATTVGGKCTTKWAVAKAGTAKVYCGKNMNTKTKKKYALAWVKSASCYVNIPAFQKSAADVATQVATLTTQINDVKTKLAAIDPKYVDTATLNNVQANINAMSSMLEQVKGQASDNLSYMQQLCP